MASGDLISDLHGFDFYPEYGTEGARGNLRLVNNPITGASITSSYRGWDLLKQSGFTGLVAETYVNKNLAATALATGITLRLTLVDDPLNPCPGLAVRLGVSVKLIQTGATAANVDFTTSSYGTEVLSTVTLNSTSGLATVTTIAIANANLQSLAKDSNFLVRVRRLGADAADTATGNVMLTHCVIYDT